MSPSDDDIRHLLASLDSPTMPVEVRERLRAVVVHQAAERADRSAGRPARRLVFTWAAAAAVVVAVATGSSLAYDRRSGSDSAQQSTSTQSSVAPPTSPPTSPQSGSSSARSADQEFSDDLAVPLPVVRSSHLARDVTAALDHADRLAAKVPGRVLADAANSTCGAPREPSPRAEVREITYDGRPALLIASPRPDGGREVSIFTCEGKRLDQITLSR